MNIIDLLVNTNCVFSKAEARKFVKAGAVCIDNIKIEDDNLDINISSDLFIKIGKTREFKINNLKIE